jgi:hypothetical protein
METINTKERLDAFVALQLPESQTLDYKLSDALDFGLTGKRDEFFRDLSSFANAAGGRIIYGFDESAMQLDDGVPLHKRTSREQLLQIANSNISPPIVGLDIAAVPGTTGTYFVADIPQATHMAPHQAPDHKYHRRYGTTKHAMQDFEVRALFRQTYDPDLYLELLCENGRKEIDLSTLENFLARTPPPVRLRFTPTIYNHSSTPALYYNVGLYFDPRIFRPADFFEFGGTLLTPDKHTFKDGTVLQGVTGMFLVPHHPPVFKGVGVKVDTGPNFLYPYDGIPNSGSMKIGYTIYAPGCSKEAIGKIEYLGDRRVRTSFETV